MSIIDRVSSRPLLLIVLPVAIALLCMISTSFSMLNAISVSVDKQDRTRTEQVVHSALGDLIFEKACRDIAPLEGLHLSVNLSPLQLNDPSLSARLQRIGAAHHLTLDRLQIEVTEAVMIRHPTRARRVLGDLHRLGIRIALDDFGAGYASLGYLRDFSFDAIKLDRSLTQAIVSDPTSQMFLHGTILIANGLAATVIAEGVETEEQLALIRLAGCQVMQGYHLGRPQPLADLLRRYKTGSGEPGKRRAG